MDSERYDALALALLRDGWLPKSAFFQAPLYPYFLATVYAVAGHSYLAVRLLQALLDSLTVLLITLAAARLFGERSGLWAGLLAALYGFMVFHVALLHKETLVLCALAVLLFLLARPHPGPGALVASGLLLGAAALLRENLLLLVPFVLAGVLEWPPALRRGLARASVFLLGVALALAPVALANRRASGEWILTSYTGGTNFLIGNARGGTGSYRPLTLASQRPEQELSDSRSLAASLLAEQTGQPIDPAGLSPSLVSRVLWAAGWREIARDPVAWIRLLARKARLFLHAYEIPDSEGLALARESSLALRLARVGFGLVAPLAGAGLVLAWRRRPRAARLLALLLAGLFASVVLFFVFGRYRLPA